jgi:hypothetical protein
MDKIELLRNVVRVAYEEAVAIAKGDMKTALRLSNLPTTGYVTFGVKSRSPDIGNGDGALVIHDYTRGSIMTRDHPRYRLGSLAWKRDRCVGRWKLVGGHPQIQLMLWGRKVTDTWPTRALPSK